MHYFESSEFPNWNILALKILQWDVIFFLTIGIEAADFVFYISAMETERCQKGMTVAYAAHCQQESALDRLVIF